MEELERTDRSRTRECQVRDFASPGNVLENIVQESKEMCINTSDIW